MLLLSRPLHISSRKMYLGSPYITLASRILCMRPVLSPLPPSLIFVENERGSFSISSVIPVISRDLSQFVSLNSRPSKMLSIILVFNNLLSSVITPIFDLHSYRGILLIFRSLHVIDPAVSIRLRERSLSNVDFPHPFEPVMQVILFCSVDRQSTPTFIYVNQKKKI